MSPARNYLRIVNPPAPLPEAEARALLDAAFRGIPHEEVVRRVHEAERDLRLAVADIAA